MTGRKQERRELRYTNAKQAAEKVASRSGSKALKLPAGVRQYKFEKKGIVNLNILPYVVGAGNPEADEGVLHYRRIYYTHGGVGLDNDTYACPKENFGKRCPVCEKAHELKKEGKRDKEYFKSVIQPLLPKEREIYLIEDDDHPEDKWMVFESSTFKFGKMLLEVVEASETARKPQDRHDDFFHLSGGSTAKVVVREATFNGNAFCEAASISMTKREKEYPDSLLDELPCLDSMVREVSYEELRKAFEAIPDEDEDPVGDHDGAPEEVSARSRHCRDEEDDEPAPRPRKARDEQEDEDDDPPPGLAPKHANGKADAPKGKFKVGDYVKHGKQECEVVEVRRDGSVVLEDSEGEDVVVEDPSRLSLIVDDDAPQDEDDEPVRKTARR